MTTKMLTPQLTMPVIAMLLSASLISDSATAETRVETIVGTVVDTITLTSTYVRKTPTDKRACRNDDVPIYAQQEGASEIGSMIIGGLIGSAVGNKFSNNDGAGAAGTVAGALIGREHSKNKQKNSRIVGYKQQETCSITTVVLEENISEITGYRNHIEVDGKIVKLESKSPLTVGSRVEVVRRVNYSLR
ncbi:MAG: hypothetical protein ACJ0BO_00805 [Candidatus Puniceispirillaceae bacterium]